MPARSEDARKPSFFSEVWLGLFFLIPFRFLLLKLPVALQNIMVVQTELQGIGAEKTLEVHFARELFHVPRSIASK